LLNQLPVIGSLISRGQAELSPDFAGIKWINWATFFAFGTSVFWAVLNFDAWLTHKARRAVGR
jgi:hypothetical protein